MSQTEIECIQYKGGLGRQQGKRFLEGGAIPDGEEAQVVAMCIVGYTGNEGRLISLDLMRSGYWTGLQTTWKKRS